ncbi:SEC-C domain-containing protein [Parvibaculum sp.]|uniref:YecA family protein n=1 Tax=Parvibaculum sp. TaxID=2024848 RepID=UPI001B00E18D|nr:SEC-C domain-containing protein [Parvibaculum sp.]MBO6668790.1 SEC-C domain-containing protein [Parvibaculum sp.]MBO6691471.1 SEC-C domain-containing protein [Parvibaculum sp.]MBO6714467.1 SEC-C domain-containing protein [Parvibaculum sp.]
MAKKLGRNDPCWCGSGKKYKKCHLGREGQESVPLWEAEQAMKKAYSQRRCLAPDEWHSECTKTIVKAHTVPKSSSLREIARDGHVYCFVPTLKNLSANNGRLVPELRGLNLASTFTGFCDRHDNQLFAPIEKTEFTASAEQCFLLAYRALAREIYTKDGLVALEEMRGQLDRGKPEDEQYQIQFLNLLISAAAETGARDNAVHKSQMDKIFLSEDFSSVRAYVVEFGEVQDVMCAGSIFPTHDFDGNQLQDISDLEPVAKAIYFTSFASGGVGYVVFVWMESDDDCCLPLVQTLDSISNEGLSNALIRFMFENFENLHLRPEWWEGLSKAQRSSLVARMSDSVTQARDHPYKDDGMRFVQWPIRRRAFLFR